MAAARRIGMFWTDFGAVATKVQVHTPFGCSTAPYAPSYRDRGYLRYSDAPA